jgi:hypothetical protein
MGSPYTQVWSFPDFSGESTGEGSNMSTWNSGERVISLLRKHAKKFTEYGTRDLRSAKIGEEKETRVQEATGFTVSSVDITFATGETIHAVCKTVVGPARPAEEITNRMIIDYAKTLAEHESNAFKLACLQHLTPLIGSLPVSKEAVDMQKTCGNSVFPRNCEAGKVTKLYFEMVSGSWLYKGLREVAFPGRANIISEICMGVAALHDVGLLHRDVMPWNIILESGTHLAKLIDIGSGLPYNDPFALDFDPVYLDYAEDDSKYCAPIEFYKYLEEKYVKDIRRGRFAKNLSKLNERLRAILQPSYDVYSIGLLILQILFGRHGLNRASAYFQKESHARIKGRAMEWPLGAMIYEYECFFRDIGKNVKSCNRRLSAKRRYTGKQCTFIARAMRACLDPNPKKRPSAAQVAEIFELFSAGMTDFNQALELARQDRPDDRPPTDWKIPT